MKGVLEMDPYQSLMKVFNTIVKDMEKTPLYILDNNWKETIEIRIPNLNRAFGSIQFCGGDKKEPYLELRFKRVHLRNANVFDIMNEINEKPFRSDVIKRDGKEPEAIRYHFSDDSLAGLKLIERIFNLLSDNIQVKSY